MSIPFVPDCHFQPLDDESAATDLSSANLIIPQDNNEATPKSGTPRVISRSVSFSGDLATDFQFEKELGDNASSDIDSSEQQHVSRATYTASEDDGALALAAREIALKTRKAQAINTTVSPSAEQTQNDILYMLEDLKHRIDNLEQSKPPGSLLSKELANLPILEMAKHTPSASSSTGSTPRSSITNSLNRSPVRKPTSSNEGDFGFGNLPLLNLRKSSRSYGTSPGSDSRFMTPNVSPTPSRTSSNADMMTEYLKVPKHLGDVAGTSSPSGPSYNRLTLSAKLAKGMDSGSAWDDGCMVWRKETKPEEKPKPKEAPKTKLFGPGLPVFDKVADPDRAEDDAATERRWVQPAPFLSFWTFLRTDLLAPSAPPQVEEAIGHGVNQFLKVPLYFERFVVFGVFTSLDLFLSVLTFLPLRSVFSILRLLISIVLFPVVAFSSLAFPLRFTNILIKIGPFSRNEVGSGKHESDKTFLGMSFRPVFHRSDAYDLLRVVLFVGTLSGLQLLDMSRVYHNIRGQALIKLYVIMSMVEIFDRLLSSFGQDALDSLYRTVSTSPFSARLIIEIPVATVYIMLHACLFFVNVATINVAVNSADQALLTLLVSNNFSEIRSSVFKKFDTNNYFQLCSSDITERFKLFIFMLLVLIMNLVQSVDKDKEIIMNFIFQTQAVFLAEVVADWIKHAFITKFNALDPSLYARFMLVLVHDVTETRHDNTRPLLDHTHSLARRIGLAQLPLACTVVRFLQDVWVRLVLRFDLSLHGQIRLIASGFVCLFLLKVLTAIVLTGVCAEMRIQEERAKKRKRLTLLVEGG